MPEDNFKFVIASLIALSGDQAPSFSRTRDLVKFGLDSAAADISIRSHPDWPAFVRFQSDIDFRSFPSTAPQTETEVRLQSLASAFACL